MSETTVLREYLVSLGFRSDPVSQKKFGTTIEGLDKKAFAFGKTVVGVGVAVQAMAVVFANQMERLYYASNRMGTTVGNLRSMEFAAKQAGVGVAEMDDALESMAAALRTNPGMSGFLRKLGVDPNQEGSKRMMAFLDAIEKYPHYIQVLYAEMVGMSEKTLFNLQSHKKEFKEAMELRSKMAAEAGLDEKAAAESGVEYKRMLNDVTAQLVVLKDTAMLAFMPMAKEFAKMSMEGIKFVTDFITHWKGLDDMMQRTFEYWDKGEGKGLLERLGRSLGFAPGKVTDKQGAGGGKGGSWMGGLAPTTDPNVARRTATGGVGGLGYHQRDQGDRGGSSVITANTEAPTGLVRKQPGSAKNQAEADKLFAKLEAQYNLPPGIMDAIWAIESGRGQNLVSPTGPRGQFQMTKENRKHYGIEGRENELEPSAEAAAKLLSELQGKFGKDPRKLGMAYNMGEPDFRAALGSGQFTPEATKYGNALAGGGVTQNTTVNIYGVDGAKEAIPAIRREIDQANSAVTRSMKQRQN